MKQAFDSASLSDRRFGEGIAVGLLQVQGGARLAKYSHSTSFAMARPHSNLQSAATPILFLISVFFSLSLAEFGARWWVSEQWSESRIRYFTDGFESRDGLVHDARLGYQPERSARIRNAWDIEFRHNKLGFRGPEISAKKPEGTIRIALMGASTVYGFFVKEDETSAAKLERLLRKRKPGLQIEVVNAGVPGWTSRETWLSLQSRIFPLDPDIVVVMDGRNEVFPQLYNHYEADYSHYRKLGFDFRKMNQFHRRLFRLSRIAMLVTTSGNGRFGFSFRDEHPLYGYIRYENQPGLDELRANITHKERVNAYRENLKNVITAARDNSMRVVLASIPFFPDLWEATGILEANPEIVPIIKRAVQRNNTLVKRLARTQNTAFVDGMRVAKREYLYDDCHLNPAGEAALAELLAEAILPLLAGS